MKFTIKILVFFICLFPDLLNAEPINYAENLRSNLNLKMFWKTDNTLTFDFLSIEENTNHTKVINNLKKTSHFKQNLKTKKQEINYSIPQQCVVSMGGNYDGNIIKRENIHNVDTSGNSVIFSKNNIKGIATSIESAGYYLGRLWTIVGFQGTGSLVNPDSLMILSSDNSGISWSPYAQISLADSDKINIGEIDVELIEGNIYSYLYIVLGIRSGGGTGKWFTVCIVVKITGNYESRMYTLNWPGYNNTKRYYCPRITSSNSYYGFNSSVYIVVSFDSAGYSGRVNTQKYAQINNPNTIFPVIYYKADKIYWVSNSNTNQYLYSDIAYYRRSNNDSLIISFCGVPDSTKVFFAKMSAAGLVSPTLPGQVTGYVGGSEPQYAKYGGRLSSDGRGTVFFIFNQKSAGTDGIKYFRSSNFGDFNSMEQSVIWTSLLGVSKPDIISLRRTTSHRFGFVFKGITDSLVYVSIKSDGTINSVSGKMNFSTPTSSVIPPAIGCRFVPNDSCFALYTNVSNSDVWSAAGCLGIPININENEISLKFNLDQNYPNPFNPFTKISYSLAKSGFVSLKVYDILGKEIIVLVDEVKSMGNYSVDFNAGKLANGLYFYKLETNGFRAVKKMVLLK